MVAGGCDLLRNTHPLVRECRTVCMCASRGSGVRRRTVGLCPCWLVCFGVAAPSPNGALGERIAVSCGQVTRRDVPCAQDELSPVKASIQMGPTAFLQKPCPEPTLLDPECHVGEPPPAYNKPKPLSSLIEPDSDNQSITFTRLPHAQYVYPP